MLRRLLTAAVILVALTAHANQGSSTKVSEEKSPEPWTQAPASFRDVPFGATLAEAQAILGPMKCTAWKEANAQTCSTKDRSKAFRAGNAVVNTFYYFHDGKFAGVSFSSGMGVPAMYHHLATAFEQKFGTPTSRAKWRYTGVKPGYTGVMSGKTYPPEPYDYMAEVVEWENDTMRAYLMEDEGGKIRYGVLETKAWQKAKEEASKKTSVSPF